MNESISQTINFSHLTPNRNLEGFNNFYKSNFVRLNSYLKSLNNLVKYNLKPRVNKQENI